MYATVHGLFSFILVDFPQWAPVLVDDSSNDRKSNENAHGREDLRVEVYVTSLLLVYSGLVRIPSSTRTDRQ